MPTRRDFITRDASNGRRNGLCSPPSRQSRAVTDDGRSPTRIVLPASAVAAPLASPSPAALRTPGVPTDAAFYRHVSTLAADSRRPSPNLTPGRMRRDPGSVGGDSSL